MVWSKNRADQFEPEPSNGGDRSPDGELGALRRELEALQARADRLQRQRDEARAQRDVARAQRDDAKQQRDNLKFAVSSDAADEIPLAAVDAPPSTQPGRRRTLRKRPPTGFAALPNSDLPSSPYSLVRFKEREEARQLMGRRIEPRVASGDPLSLAEREIAAPRKVPHMRRHAEERICPGPDVAFVTVADIGFFPGLTGLVLSLLDVYPEFSSSVFVFHDGSISRFAQERLIEIYPNIEFIVPDMNWLDLSEIAAADSNRIGKLGYMKFLALTLAGYERVVILDADLLIVGDISPLWIGGGGDARAVYDLGNREFALQSGSTGSWIINSGVISLPGAWCAPDQLEVARATIIASLTTKTDLLDQFADQKAWNLFLSSRELSLLEVNFNCNVKYVGRFLGGKLEGVSILHFAGPKPWNSTDYLPVELIFKRRTMACVFPNIWVDRYRTLLFNSRSRAFRRDAEERARRAGGATAASALLTDDWTDDASARALAGEHVDVVHAVREGLPDWFESLAPRHVLFASHDVLGGWNSLDPHIPSEFAQRVAGLERRPTVWAPYYFKPLFEVFSRQHGIEVRYLLHEAPFVRQVADVGVATARADGFIDSCGNDSLTFAAPVAVACAYRELLVAPGAGGRSHGRNAEPLAVALLTDDLRENGVELLFPAAVAPLVARAEALPETAQ